MHAPSVSVVMPAFNVERFVAEAVESVLDQTFTDLELVAVDDGSTDGTRRILDGYAQRDARMRVVSTLGKGFVDALTTGIAAARGPLIARMDADDRSVVDRLERQAEVLRADASIDLVGSSIQVIDRSGHPRHVVRYPLTDPIIRLALRHGPAFAHGAVLIRREVLVAAGGYSAAAHPADDYELWCRLAVHGARGENIDRPLYEYRINDQGISRTRPEQMRRRAREVGAAYGRMLRRQPAWRELRGAIRSVERQVTDGQADPASLRRASRSLADAAPLWARRAPVTGLRCVGGALVAEAAYRRSRRAPGR